MPVMEPLDLRSLYQKELITEMLHQNLLAHMLIYPLCQPECISLVAVFSLRIGSHLPI